MRFKKIASVLASAAMVFSTVGFAAATTYPAPFVDNGVANVAVVYGSHPSAQSDLLAAVNIVNSLNTYALENSVSNDNSTIEGGDYVQIEKASTKFWLGRGILDVISGTLTDDDLPVVLADGTYTDADKNDKDYTQKIVLANLSLSLFEDSDYKADTPTVGIRAASGAHVLNYSLDFSDEPDWTNLANTELTLMGKEYYISSITNGTTINLLDAANTAILNEGETTTVVVGDMSYEVSVVVFGTNEAVLTVNGETTDGLAEGQTEKLSDGTYVGVKDIRYVSRDNGAPSQVEFSIGAGKIELKNGQDVKINDKYVTGLTTYITNGASSGATTLRSIVLKWVTDDDSFVTDDENLVLPGLENVKFSFDGMYYPTEEKFTLEKGSSTYIRLSGFNLKDGPADINLLYGNGTDFTGVGREDTKKLRTSAVNSIIFDGDTDEYFVATYDDGTQGESYLMRATGYTTENSINKTTIQYYSDGEWKNKKADSTQGDSVTLGSVALTVNKIDKDAKTVNLTIGGNSNFHTLVSKEGLKVYLPYEYFSTNYTLEGTGLTGNLKTNNTAEGRGTANTAFTLYFSEEDKNGNTDRKNFTAALGWTSTKATVTAIGGESPDGGEEIGDTDVFESYIYGPLATKILFDTSGDQDSVEITYHGGESYGKVFLTAYAASVGGSSGGNVPQPMLDTEVASASGKNIIVVGGSCVNTVAAELLGKQERFCGTEWTTATQLGADQFLIQSFSRTGGKVATLVAGWAAQDTANAATALTTQENVDTTPGKKYTGSTADSIQAAM